MKRRHLFETHEEPWCPRPIRDAETDYLQFAVAKTRPYAPLVPILVNALQRAGARQVLDLCAGAGGPWFRLQPELAARGWNVSVLLSDKFPNDSVTTQSGTPTNPMIRYHPSPVDATQVPAELTGFRTLFSSFHHFRPDDARALLADAVRRREGIAVVEGSHRSVCGLLAGFLVPLMVLAVTPFIRPFRWSRLILTYLVPVVPLDCAFGWVVSCLRTYTIAELRAMTESLHAEDYTWDIGEVRHPASPIPITYLIGCPKDPEV